MPILSRMVPLALPLALASACSLSLDRERPGGDDARITAPDGLPPVDGPRPGDGGPPDGPVRPPPSTSVLQVVVNRFLLPTNSGVHALDLDGDAAVDNQLGAVLAVIATAMSDGFDLQQSVDDGLAEGKTLFMFDVLADSLVDSPVRLQAYLGEDQDGDPKDNFSGSERFSLSVESPADVALDGTITGGELRTAGAVVMPLIVSDQLFMLPLSRARVEGRISAGGMTDGIVAGAIPIETVHGTFLAEVARRVDDSYQNAAPGSSTRKQLDDLFDSDDNGKITVQEIIESPVIGLLIKPDIDTDGDGKDDAMSAGFGFTAVPCEIDLG